MQFKIAELHNNYQRRAMTELRETDRLVLELTVTLPAAQRARAARALQMRLPTGEQGPQPPITVIRTKGDTTAKYDAAVDFLLQPGDVVQVGSLLPPSPELPPNQVGLSREQKAEGGALLQAGDAAALRTPPLDRRGPTSERATHFSRSEWRRMTMIRPRPRCL